MVRRLLATILILDGLVTVAWGQGFLAWQRGFAPTWHRAILDKLLSWPESLLRLGAAAQAGLGVLLLFFRRP